jgi:hypothetical protein
MKALLIPIFILLFIAQPGITAQSAPDPLPSSNSVTIYLTATPLLKRFRKPLTAALVLTRLGVGKTLPRG